METTANDRVGEEREPDRPGDTRPGDTRPGDNRQRIVAAAYRVLGSRGYEAATIKEIAREAGVAPGLIHYYFADKEALLVAVLDEASEQHLRETQRLRAALPGGRLLQVALAERRGRVSSAPEWYRLRYELFALGLRNPAIRPGLARLLANGRQGIAGVVRAAAPNASLDPELVAAILLGALDGLALQKLADPDFDIDGAFAVVEQLVES